MQLDRCLSQGDITVGYPERQSLVRAISARQNTGLEDVAEFRERLARELSRLRGIRQSYRLFYIRIPESFPKGPDVAELLAMQGRSALSDLGLTGRIGRHELALFYLGPGPEEADGGAALRRVLARLDRVWRQDEAPDELPCEPQVMVLGGWTDELADVAQLLAQVEHARCSARGPFVVPALRLQGLVLDRLACDWRQGASPEESAAEPSPLLVG